MGRILSSPSTPHASRVWLCRLYFFTTGFAGSWALKEAWKNQHSTLGASFLLGLTFLFAIALWWAKDLGEDKEDLSRLWTTGAVAWFFSPMYFVATLVCALLETDSLGVLFASASFLALPIWLVFVTPQVRFDRGSRALVLRWFWPFFFERRRLHVDEIAFLAPRSHTGGHGSSGRTSTTWTIAAVGRDGGTIEFGEYRSVEEAEKVVERFIGEHGVRLRARFTPAE